MTSLHIQLQTSEKVLELTNNVGTLAESAREASKLSLQIADILHLVDHCHGTADAIHDLSNDVKTLKTDAQGIVSRSHAQEITSRLLLSYRGKGPAVTGLALNHSVFAKAP